MGHKGSFSILLMLRLEVLVRLQLPLFGQEGESNIHRAEGGKVGCGVEESWCLVDEGEHKKMV